MRVVLVYDIETTDSQGQKRLNKARKVAKKYLHHVQKSVFEGSLSISNLERLKAEIMKVVDKNKDSVILYIFDNLSDYRREILTESNDPTDNLI
ncbi:CRISPR-associated endonuclease Cas2 [Thermocrinis sp.]